MLNGNLRGHGHQAIEGRYYRVMLLGMPLMDLQNVLGRGWLGRRPDPLL